MERRRHERIPVELNAVLIGEKTVPRGCKVRNLSQYGMMLKCVSDGRVATFQEGSNVNIHLLFQQSGGCKYLTKSADVRHAGDGTLGVEFHEPDAHLVEFLRPDLPVSIEDTEPVPAVHHAAMTDGIDMHQATNAEYLNEHMKAVEPRPVVAREKAHSSWLVLYAGFSLMLLAAGLVIGAYLYTSQISARVSILENVTDRHTAQLTEIQEWALPASMLEGKFAYLNAQLKALTDSFTSLESRLTGNTGPTPVKIVAAGDTSAAAGVTGPDSGTGEPDSGAAAAYGETTPDNVVPPTVDVQAREVTPANREPERNPAGETRAAAETTPAPAATAAPGGPWVVNLYSSPDRAETERFAARARASGFPVHSVQADVKGRSYWRVQLTGYPSQSAARAGAEPVRKKLGLGDVWIFRQ